MSTLARLCFLALSVSFWMPATAEARPPRGVSMTGTIQSVDAATRKIVFVQDDGPVHEFVWVGRTKFWHDAARFSPTSLKPGMRVRVTLHNPLFGEDYVTRIVLLDPLHEEGDITNSLPSHHGS